MKKRFNIVFRLLSLLGNLSYIIILAVLGGVLGNLSAICVMLFGSMAVCKLIDANSISLSMNAIIALLITSGVLRGLLRFLEQYNNHFIAFKLLACLRDKIFTALRRLSPAKLESKQKGNIIAMLTSDVETLEVFYAHTISPVMISLIVNGGIVIFISIFANVYIGLCALLSYLIIGVVIPFYSQEKLKDDGNEYRKQFASANSYFLDSIRGINEIILNDNQINREKEIDNQSNNLNKMNKNIKIKASRYNALSSLIVSLTILFVLLIGIIFVKNGSLSLEHMIIASTVIFSSFGPVLALASLPANLTQTFASGERIIALLDEKPVVEEVINGQNFEFNNLKIQNMSFSYHDKKVLKNINLEINKNDIVGLVGESGCGKSTLLKLLLRFYDVSDGDILYNDINIKDISSKSLHQNVTLVSQDTYLFNDSIINNIKISKPDATLLEVRKACQDASIDDFIMSLDHQYDEEVGLLGERLSAGEKQRIGLARAFLSGTKVILLDEVTSNVDAINEGIILKSLKEISKDKTIIIVSHRESTISICNKIYRIKDGEING